MSSAMKDCLSGVNKRISLLIEKVRGNLTKDMRTKIITLITIDVHSRDVVQKLIKFYISDKEEFMWLSQLKFYYQKDVKEVKQRKRFPWEKDSERNK